jgi:hypothetical protein
MPWGRLENGSNGSKGFRKDPDSRNAGLLVCSGIGIFSGTSSDVALNIYRQTQRCQRSDIDFTVIVQIFRGAGA